MDEDMNIESCKTEIINEEDKEVANLFHSERDQEVNIEIHEESGIMDKEMVKREGNEPKFTEPFKVSFVTKVFS